MTPPDKNELNEYYRSYCKYVNENDLRTALKADLNLIQEFKNIPEEKENYRYAEGKWMLKEIIGHLCDTERILTYRALCFARGESNPLPGFDENNYVEQSNYSNRSLANILGEYESVRLSSILFFESVDESKLDIKGIANGNPYTARQMAFFITGHARHHFSVIREKYL